jgi:hypothetical protein
MVGARIFLPPSRLGMIVNYSPLTLPGWMKDRLNSFGEEMWYFKERLDGLGTTRSVQVYKNGIRYVRDLDLADGQDRNAGRSYTVHH